MRTTCDLDAAVITTQRHTEGWPRRARALVARRAARTRARRSRARSFRVARVRRRDARVPRVVRCVFLGIDVGADSTTVAASRPPPRATSRSSRTTAAVAPAPRWSGSRRGTPRASRGGRGDTPVAVSAVRVRGPAVAGGRRRCPERLERRRRKSVEGPVPECARARAPSRNGFLNSTDSFARRRSLRWSSKTRRRASRATAEAMPSDRSLSRRR